jgi:hypothetical protein
MERLNIIVLERPIVSGYTRVKSVIEVRSSRFNISHWTKLTAMQKSHCTHREVIIRPNNLSLNIIYVREKIWY